MKALIDKDLVIGIAEGDISDIEIPMKLQNLPLSQLRFDGQKIVDASTYTTFYVDENGTKHIIQHNPSWQELQCKFDDELVNENGVWRVKTKEDYLKELKQDLKNQVTQLRKQKENKGIIVKGFSNNPNIYRFDTSLTGRANTQAVLQAFSLGLISQNTTIHWKFLDGFFFDITLDQLHELAAFALDYVEKLFTAERNHHVTIDNLRSKDEAKHYDINVNWPSNKYTSKLLP